MMPDAPYDTLTTDQGTFRVYRTTRRCRYAPVWQFAIMPNRAVFAILDLVGLSTALCVLEYVEDSERIYHPRRVRAETYEDYERVSSMYGTTYAERVLRECGVVRS